MGTFGLLLAICPITHAADWPGLRGPARDGVSTETGLAAWPKEGPALKWTFNSAGAGYGSPAVVNGTVYLLGTKDKNEVVLAIDGATGSPLITQTNEATELTLSCETPESSIYYTTDGSFPTPAKTLYTAAIPDPEVGTVFRAAAYVTGLNPSDAVEFTIR
jgi:hypothetical protein